MTGDRSRHGEAWSKEEFRSHLLLWGTQRTY